MYELKEYLKAINTSKEPLMDSEDVMWEKKYSPYITNRCLYPFSDTILLVNEMNIYKMFGGNFSASKPPTVPYSF